MISYMYFNRAIDLNGELKKNKVVVIYGPRQTGKTMLIKDLILGKNINIDHFIIQETMQKYLRFFLLANTN